MKCPKCGYVGFEETPRCRHCGYEFALATPLGAPIGPARTMGPSSGDDAGSLVDEFFAAPKGGETPALDRLGFVDLQTDAPAEPAPLADLPLADPPPSDLFASPPPARPPLAVRRTAERPRSRPATQIVRRSPAGLLDVEVSPPEASPAEPVAVTSTGAASIPARLGAGLIDVALLAGIALVVVYFTVRLAGLTMAEVGSLPLPPLAAFLLGLAVAYLAAFTACGGQTLGKMAAGLRVVAEDGAVPPGTAALRAVAALAGGALAGLGFLPALFDAEHRGVHDRLTGTRVVRG